MQTDRPEQNVRGVQPAPVIRRQRVRRGEDQAAGPARQEQRAQLRRVHRRGPAAVPGDERGATLRRHRGRAHRRLRRGPARQRSDRQTPVVRVPPDRQSGAVREHVQERGRQFGNRKGK